MSRRRRKRNRSGLRVIRIAKDEDLNSLRFPLMSIDFDRVTVGVSRAGLPAVKLSLGQRAVGGVECQTEKQREIAEAVAVARIVQREQGWEVLQL